MPRFNYYKYEITFEDNGKVCQKTGTAIASCIDKASRNISMVYDKKVISLNISKVDIAFPIDELMKIFDSTLVREDIEIPPTKRPSLNGRTYHLNKYFYYHALGDEGNAKMELMANIKQCEHKTQECITEMPCVGCPHSHGNIN